MHRYLTNSSSIKPARIVRLPDAFFRNAPDMTFRELAYVVLDILIGDEFAPGELKALTDRSLSDTRPFSPDAEASFVATLWHDTVSAGTNTLVCAVEADDMHLLNALSRTPDAPFALVPRDYMHMAPAAANVVEVQGSPSDCRHLCDELDTEVPLCTMHNAAADAVRVAVAIYCATHIPAGTSATALLTRSEAMLRACDTARTMGLKLSGIDTSTATAAPAPASAADKDSRTPRRHPRRVAPTVEAVVRLLNENQATITHSSAK